MFLSDKYRRNNMKSEEFTDSNVRINSESCLCAKSQTRVKGLNHFLIPLNYTNMHTLLFLH